MVNKLVVSPSIRRVEELKWNHITRPEVIRRAERAPVNGHGLGFTMWKACVWWVIKCCHVDIGLRVE